MLSEVRSDDELLLLVGAGDHRAFATLYDHFAGLVQANVRRVLHDIARTDAVAEEAFMEVWRRAARFDPTKRSAATWILGLAHQLAVERDQDDLAAPLGTPLANVPTLRSGLVHRRATPRAREGVLGG